MKIDLGILFAFWLKDHKSLTFDDYVAKYKNDDIFRKDVNNQEDINEYKEIKGGTK